MEAPRCEKTRDLADMRRRTYLIILISMAVSSALAWMFFSGPMLIRVHIGLFQGDPRIGIWNPIRSRAPEEYGAGLIRGIQSSKCQAVADLSISNDQKIAVCEKQSRAPVTANCRLVDRSDRSSTVWLLFQCPYQQYPDARADIGVTVTLQRSAWALSSYERIY
jgi:hypothetical protein